MTQSLDGSLPIVGRVAAQPPGGVDEAERGFQAQSTAATPPSGRFAAIFPSRGERDTL
jgi:hypothetical protein